MKTNPYIPPEPPISLAPHAMVSSDSGHTISETELTAFTGKSTYPQLWLRRLESRSRFAGFNGWAAVFTIQWFFYRKLYLFGLIALAFEIGVVLIWFALLEIMEVSDKDPAALSALFFILIFSRIVIGYLANLALYTKAVRVIRKIDALNANNEAHLRMIKYDGGVSVPALFLIYACLGILQIGSRF